MTTSGLCEHDDVVRDDARAGPEEDFFARNGYLVVEDFLDANQVGALRSEGARLASQDETSQRVAALASKEKQEHQNQGDAMKFVESASGVACFYEKDGETVNKIGHALHDKVDVFRGFSRSQEVKHLLRYDVDDSCV